MAPDARSLPQALNRWRIEQHPTCGLTLRSSGPPPASRLAREALTVIIRLAGQAPSRRRPLSSNVRPQKDVRANSPRARQEQVEFEGRPSFSDGSRGSTRMHLWPAQVRALCEAPRRTTKMGKAQPDGTERSGRPSFGGRLTDHCPRPRPIAGGKSLKQTA
jgi:hypothetical protein